MDTYSNTLTVIKHEIERDVKYPTSFGNDKIRLVKQVNNL